MKVFEGIVLGIAATIVTRELYFFTERLRMARQAEDYILQEWANEDEESA